MFPSITLQFLNVLFSSIFILVSFLGLNSTENWYQSLAVVSPFVLITCIVGFVKYCLAWYAQSPGNNSMWRCRKNSMIGFGVMTICGIIYMIALFWVGYTPLPLIFSAAVFNVISLLFVILFAFRAYNLCEIETPSSSRRNRLFMECYLIHLLICAMAAGVQWNFTTKTEVEQDLFDIFFPIFGVVFIASTLELLVVRCSKSRVGDLEGKEMEDFKDSAEKALLEKF